VGVEGHPAHISRMAPGPHMRMEAASEPGADDRQSMGTIHVDIIVALSHSGVTAASSGLRRVCDQLRVAFTVIPEGRGPVNTLATSGFVCFGPPCRQH
jgi:hypothetical protein